MGRADVPGLSNNAEYEYARRRSFIGRRNDAEHGLKSNTAHVESFNPCPPKDSLLDESFFAAKVVSTADPMPPR